MWGGVFSNRSIKKYLIDKISQDNPEIRKEADDLKRLHIIREWVFKETMLAGTKDFYGTVFDKGTPGTVEYYDAVFSSWEMEGYYCWEMAEYLAEIYVELGYPSLVLDVAFLNETQTIVDSHAVTLVKYKDKWIIEDPTFNISFMDKEGNILDIRELRNRIKRRESLEIIHGREENKLYISSLSHYGGVYEKVGSNEKNGVYFYTVRMDADSFLTSRREILEPIFAQKNLQLTPENMYEFCYKLYLPSNADKINLEHCIEEKQRLEYDLKMKQLHVDK